MITKREFIEYLEELPDETIIQVIEMRNGGYYDHPEWAALDIGVNTSFYNLRGNPFSTGTEREGKVYLELGVK